MCPRDFANDVQYAEQLLGQLSGLGDGQLNAAMLFDQSTELLNVLEGEELLNVRRLQRGTVW